MKISGLLLLMALAACPRVFAGEPPRYEINAKVDAKTHKLTAVQEVTFSNPASRPLSSLYFHIYPHRHYRKEEIRFLYRYAGYFKVNPFPEGFQSGDLRVKKVSCEGRELVFQETGEDKTILEAVLPFPLEPGKSVKISIDFDVDIPHAYGRFGWHGSIISLNRWYPLLAVCDEEGWHNYPSYLYHHPYFSEAAYYSVTVTVAADQVVAATAGARSELLNPDGTKTLVLATDFPVRDFALALSPDYRLYTLAAGATEIRSYYLPGDRRRAEEAAANAASLMRFYSRRFGGYPWKQYSIVPNYLGYGGDQSSCFIFIDTRVYQLPRFLDRYFDFLIAHETGHQWFYNLIGSDEYRQMFIDEGMNSFWLLQYLEDKYGPGAKVLELPGWLSLLVPNFSFRDSTAFRYRYMAKTRLDRPVIGALSSFQEPSSIFAITYGKGAAIIDMLRSQIGADVFDAVLRRYSSEFRFKNAALDDLVRIAEEESGQQLGWFFDQWLKTADICDYAVSAVKKEAVVIRNRGTLAMPVSTRVIFRDGTEKTDRYSGKEQEHLIPTDGKSVSQVEVDPQSAISLDIDRTNNYWPRKVFLKPVPWYFFAHELPIALPRDSYNLVAGPSFGGSSTGLAASFQKPLDGIARISSVYDFNGKAWDSRLGYEFPRLFGKQSALGFELFDYASGKDGFDLRGGKLYLRRELWPASYGIFDSNDHVTVYLLRDKKMSSSGGLYGKEEIKNTLYRRSHEAIVGLAGTFGRYGPYPDPVYGWKIIPTQEFAGHFLGGRESFWRSSLELNTYRPLVLSKGHTAAAKIKFGWGEASDKSLFQLGGAEGLRGYQAKTIEGAHMLLGSLEYRFPLARGMRRNLLWNAATLDTIQGVGFVDFGRAWYGSYSRADFKKDIGFGLRFHCDLFAFLEKAVVRLDLARPLNDEEDDPRLWVGLSQSF